MSPETTIAVISATTDIILRIVESLKDLSDEEIEKRIALLQIKADDLEKEMRK